MALSDDQRALLRLLARREDSYEDIAALKGMSVAEVRAEVSAALEELDAPPEPAAAKPAAPDPPAPEPPAPEPPAPPKPAPPGKPSPTETADRPSRPSRQLRTIPPERRRLLAFTGGAVGIVAVVLIAIAVFGGDSGSDTSTAAGDGSGGEAAETASSERGGLTQATLKPVDGSDGSGQAIFGRVGKEEVVLQVTAENLEPAQGDNSYTVWLYRSPQLALRVGSAKVNDSGQLGARFPIPTELLAYVASGAFKQIKVSRTSDAAFQAELKKAEKQKDLPPYAGETVLGGKISGPIVRAGSSQEG